ncbi:MAG: ATP-binding cassette domain-containing protein [Vicinamibacteria bacterium]|nr:ATP-binding cassette domain-containing protein [Vicinamibacteria bacterium]
MPDRAAGEGGSGRGTRVGLFPGRGVMSAPALVEARNLSLHFKVTQGALRRAVGTVKAVDNVSFDIVEGETLGLVGESGCGKSSTGRVLLRLAKPTSGQVRFVGQDLGRLSPSELRRARRQMQMIFQSPFTSLNPRLTVEQTLREPLEIHGLGSNSDREARVQELLALVGLDPGAACLRPHEFSGGQRQRIGIARALATGPRFVVADEPISALDVSIRAQIVNLMLDLKARLGLTYLLIAHDLGMVRHMSDRVAVMYLGRMVEIAECDDLFDHPGHPYTKALLSAIPPSDPDAARDRVVLEGDLPSPLNPPSGCRFRTRCPMATELCALEEPLLRVLGSGPAHRVACHHA